MNTKIINTFVLILALAAVLYLAYTNSQRLLTNYAQSVRNQAVDGCLQSTGVYEYVKADEGIRTTAPQKEYYSICMADKGYPTSWK